jgi:hypothetical protein
VWIFCVMNMEGALSLAVYFSSVISWYTLSYFIISEPMLQ